MAATSYVPGENAQEIFTDANGNRFDERGNIVTGGPTPDLNPNALCYRTDRGQWLRYADVFPGPVNVHQNQPLSDFAIAYEVENPGVAARIAPVHTVQKRSDIYYIIGDKGQEVLRTPTDESDLRAVGATANEVQDVFDTSTYTVMNRAYRDFLPDEVADNADEVLQLTQHITQFLTAKLETRWDARAINLLSTFTNTATFATACGVAGKYITDATATARYVQAAFNYAIGQTILNNALMPANTFVGGLDVCQAIAASAEVAPQTVYDLGRQYLTNGGLNASGPTKNILTGGMPEVYGNLRTVCAYNTQNTAKKGQTASFSSILTKAFYVLHVNQPSRRTYNAITTFRKGGLVTRSYRDEGRRGTYIEVEMIQVEQVTNQAGGYKITAALA